MLQVALHSVLRREEHLRTEFCLIHRVPPEAEDSPQNKNFKVHEDAVESEASVELSGVLEVLPEEPREHFWDSRLYHQGHQDSIQSKIDHQELPRFPKPCLPRHPSREGSGPSGGRDPN